MTYNWSDLLYLMQRLRDPEHGCPWDKEQTLASIVPHTLEEVYEVVDAIDKGDLPHLIEELGDLLFQVVFYAQILADQGQGNMEQVVDGLVRKLVFRHPHVFPDGLYGSKQQPDLSIDLHQQWDELKAQEKARSTQNGKSQQNDKPSSLADSVPLALPALQRAYKLQKKAAKQGFDWPDIQGPIAKIEEELQELLAAEPDQQQAEAGDLLFSVVNLLRKMQIDPEQALRQANHKFSHRFAQVEQQANSAGGMAAHDLDALEQFWQQAKQQES